MRARAPTRPRKASAPKAVPKEPRKTAPKSRPPAQGTAVSPSPKPGRPEVRIFVSYSHVDREIRRRLETHLAPLRADNVETWFDGAIDSGDKLDASIARALREAHVFVGLISADYLASHYCWRIEYRRAMNRRARGTMRVVAVVVRPCDWKSTPAAGFKLLPEDGRTLQEWRSVDAALLDVVRGIRRIVASVRKGLAAEAPKPSRRTAKAVDPVQRTGGRSSGGGAPEPKARAKPMRPRGAKPVAGKPRGGRRTP